MPNSSSFSGFVRFDKSPEAMRDSALLTAFNGFSMARVVKKQIKAANEMSTKEMIIASFDPVLITD
ncbi:hypothetical protein KAN5_30290 [Pseudoalteromonas sp. KAN5]|nr:hypothetical protein KAN5_30290 [Pseudoalteromonas sp. KAN5]